MLRHVVLFTWNEGVTDEQVQLVSEGLAGLPGVIPQIKHYHHGPNVGPSDRNFDYAVVGDFESFDDYVVYRDNNIHQQVIAERIAPLIDKRVAVQYNL